jgi:hypothetical protein
MTDAPKRITSPENMSDISSKCVCNFHPSDAGVPSEYGSDTQKKSAIRLIFRGQEIKENGKKIKKQ